MKESNSKFRAGMYLLETLTAGMYNEPLSIYREYIQNAADSFDLVKKAGRRGPQLVKIDLDPIEKYISISDNGVGIPAKIAEETLSSIGSSEKRKCKFRGFRGIGRLGGIAFCDKAVFRTKASGEDVESVQEWDCKRLRGLLSDTNKKERSLKNLFDDTTSFRQMNCKKTTGSYFNITLYDVSSFRNHILNVSKIEKYLQTVAPVPFDYDNFEYGTEIGPFLSKNVSNFEEYSIKLNGQKIFKPYKTKIRTSNKKYDPIECIDLLEIEANNEIVAYGWYAKRTEFIGAITRSEGVSGIRVRDGNIMIGDNHLLDNCFREKRFNSYLMGEIHIANPNLIPNSRRDDFIDNEVKTLFYNDIEKRIGLPLSKEIRMRSRLKSQGLILNNNREVNAENYEKDVKMSDTKTSISNQKELISSDRLTKKEAIQVLNEIFFECGDIKKIKKIKKKYNL